MDINNLHAFIEVAERKSFSKSAVSLKLTQPAVSKRIAALESALSSRLFDRVGRTVYLTEAGAVLLPSALKISSEVSRIEDEISNLGKEVRGKLNISLTEHVGVERIAPFLKTYREKYPDVEIDLQFASTIETLSSIENGIVDMGLCSTMDVRPPDKTHSRLENLEIWSDNLVFVVEKNHPLAHNHSVSVEQLGMFPAILPKQNSAVRKSIDKILSDSKVENISSVEASDFSTLSSMAAIGLGWACLPESELDDSLEILNVENIALTHTVALVKNSDRSMSRAAQAFVDSLPALMI